MTIVLVSHEVTRRSKWLMLVASRTDRTHGTALGVERPGTPLRRCQWRASLSYRLIMQMVAMVAKVVYLAFHNLLDFGGARAELSSSSSSAL